VPAESPSQPASSTPSAPLAPECATRPLFLAEFLTEVLPVSVVAGAAAVLGLAVRIKTMLAGRAIQELEE